MIVACHNCDGHTQILQRLDCLGGTVLNRVCNSDHSCEFPIDRDEHRRLRVSLEASRSGIQSIQLVATRHHHPLVTNGDSLTIDFGLNSVSGISSKTRWRQKVQGSSLCLAQDCLTQRVLGASLDAGGQAQKHVGVYRFNDPRP